MELIIEFMQNNTFASNDVIQIARYFNVDNGEFSPFWTFQLKKIQHRELSLDKDFCSIVLIGN